jgi:STE24 endopeptidase
MIAPEALAFWGSPHYGIGMIQLTPILSAYLVIYMAVFIFELILERLNMAYLEKKGATLPQPFQETISPAELKQIHSYTVKKTNFSMIQQTVVKLIFLAIILSGMLPRLSEKLQNLHAVPAGLIFFAVIGFLLSLSTVPFDYYHSFIIESRYGFNTKTVKIWLTDLFKTALVSTVIAAVLISAILLTIQYLGKTWWLWTWAAFMSFQLFLIVIYPTVIAPLFNTFIPLQDPDLKQAIEELAAKEGLGLQGIYQMDASRRTRHTNAYFTGLGRSKRIVLFDSLIRSHPVEEILAILSHEIGHLKKNHIKKHLIFSGFASLLLFFAASRLITWETMYHSFGYQLTSPYIGLFLVGILWEPLGFLLSPLGKMISRKFERQADRYSFKAMHTAEPLVAALKKMAKDNLANLKPHPLYVWFHYSHPPLLERIQYLESRPA